MVSPVYYPIFNIGPDDGLISAGCKEYVMIEFLAILFMAMAGVAGAACAINFFWDTGFKRAAGYAAFFVCIILLFWVSGLWQGASRHAWGFLTPVFALMIVAGWLGIKYAPTLWKIWKDRIGKQ